jgi:hypothetical protein
MKCSLHLSQIIILGSCLIYLSSNTNKKSYEIQTIQQKTQYKVLWGINIGRQSKNSNTKGDKNTEPITKLLRSLCILRHDKNQERKVFRAGVALQ